MSEKLLSVIITVFNAEKYLFQSIESILTQTYHNFELIIINDCSTDGSKTIIETFNDERIKYYENNQNKGIVYSRNRGLDLAKGDYIGMLDADDIAFKDKFEKQINYLSNNPEYGMIGSWVKLIDEDGVSLNKEWKLKSGFECIPSIMLFKNYFLQSAVLYTKECIKKYRFKEGFDILEDYVIWLEILKNYKGYSLQESLVYYRIHQQGVTKKYSSEKDEKERRVFSLQLKGLGLIPTKKQLLLHQAIKNDEKITSYDTFKELEKWLKEIISTNLSTNAYNRKCLSRVVFNRWLKVCYKARNLHFKMIFCLISSKLSANFLKSYLLNK